MLSGSSCVEVDETQRDHCPQEDQRTRPCQAITEMQRGEARQGGAGDLDQVLQWC